MKKPTYYYRFNSSSGTAVYETLQYSDGSLSCDCPGWCRRVASDGSRSCKHTRSVQAGLGQVEAKLHGLLSGSLPVDSSKPAAKPTQLATPHQPLKRKLAI